MRYIQRLCRICIGISSKLQGAAAFHFVLPCLNAPCHAVPYPVPVPVLSYSVLPSPVLSCTAPLYSAHPAPAPCVVPPCLTCRALPGLSSACLVLSCSVMSLCPALTYPAPPSAQFCPILLGSLGPARRATREGNRRQSPFRMPGHLFRLLTGRAGGQLTLVMATYAPPIS